MGCWSAWKPECDAQGYCSAGQLSRFLQPLAAHGNRQLECRLISVFYPAGASRPTASMGQEAAFLQHNAWGLLPAKAGLAHSRAEVEQAAAQLRAAGSGDDALVGLVISPPQQHGSHCLAGRDALTTTEQQRTHWWGDLHISTRACLTATMAVQMNSFQGWVAYQLPSCTQNDLQPCSQSCEPPALQRAVRSVSNFMHKMQQRGGQSCSNAVLLSSWVSGSAVDKQLPKHSSAGSCSDAERRSAYIA